MAPGRLHLQPMVMESEEGQKLVCVLRLVMYDGTRPACQM